MTPSDHKRCGKHARLLAFELLAYSVLVGGLATASAGSGHIALGSLILFCGGIALLAVGGVSCPTIFWVTWSGRLVFLVALWVWIAETTWGLYQGNIRPEESVIASWVYAIVAPATLQMRFVKWAIAFVIALRVQAAIVRTVLPGEWKVGRTPDGNEQNRWKSESVTLNWIGLSFNAHLAYYVGIWLMREIFYGLLNSPPHDLTYTYAVLWQEPLVGAFLTIVTRPRVDSNIHPVKDCHPVGPGRSTHHSAIIAVALLIATLMSGSYFLLAEGYFVLTGSCLTATLIIILFRRHLRSRSRVISDPETAFRPATTAGARVKPDWEHGNKWGLLAGMVGCLVALVTAMVIEAA